MTADQHPVAAVASAKAGTHLQQHVHLNTMGGASGCAAVNVAAAKVMCRVCYVMDGCLFCLSHLCRQCYLEDDRLCYCQPDKLAGSSIGGSSNGATGSAPFTVTSYTASSTAAGGLSSTVSSAAALAAGHIKYIALDRIPVRPLPHRQHSMEPMRQSHPDVGIAIIDARCDVRLAPTKYSVCSSACCQIGRGCGKG